MASQGKSAPVVDMSTSVVDMDDDPEAYDSADATPDENRYSDEGDEYVPSGEDDTSSDSEDMPALLDENGIEMKREEERVARRAARIERKLQRRGAIVAYPTTDEENEADDEEDEVEEKEKEKECEGGPVEDISGAIDIQRALFDRLPIAKNSKHWKELLRIATTPLDARGAQ